MSPLIIGEREYIPRRQPLLIAGPCALEDAGAALRIARACRQAADDNGFFYVFKGSYLKDNRSSLDSYRGPGIEEGLKILRKVGSETGAAVMTDVHCREEIGAVADVCDIIQIPAFLCRQTRLIVAASGTGKVLNLKKGQFLSPEEMGLAVEKAAESGAGGVMVTERGTSFGYHNLVVDMTSFPRMRDLGVPLIFDATHSLQLPGKLGDRTGGRPQFVSPLARAAVAAGCDGLFIETHPNPLSCRCDAEVMLPLQQLSSLLAQISALFDLINSFN
ncbi:MAG: 3-deoxy-8-phosphooctulonate synthase [Candidatus Latescibacteria bacterium]|nr:3-deoxy-8-phosphooctulonate synthase [bacterium]MBD3424991.1 3-deoxy-8-phosphooctulonate synthase [Candidatus Latescibacterota bacterium]